MALVSSERVETQTSMARSALQLVPGLVLLAVLRYVAKLIEQAINNYGKVHHLSLPNIEYVLWAILFGLVIANTVGVPKVFRPGVDTYEFWLKLGIVFQGVRFLLGDVFRLGGFSLLFVVFELAFSILLMTWLGKKFQLTEKLISLLAIGSSICGISAIVAAKGAIDADDEEVSYAIAAILALGAFSLIAFPFIGHLLHMSDHAFGLWGRARCRQYGRNYCRWCLVLRCCCEVRNHCKDHAQCDHRFRCARLRSLLDTERGSARRPSYREQSTFSLAEDAQVRPRFSPALSPCDTWRV